jgi:SSS family solute:Na+ symporter
VPGLGGKNPDLQYNNAIPLLIGKYFPEGMLGLAITGLVAAFMAGVAANVTSFNTVFTYDLWQSYAVKDRDTGYYLAVGRIATVGGLAISIATAFIAKEYSNVMNYVQLLFSYFNAPLFATFIIAMFWRRATPLAGALSMIAGFLAAFIAHLLYSKGQLDLGSAIASTWWQAVIAFVADAVVLVGVSLVTKPKPEDELRGLVWGLKRKEQEEDDSVAGDDAWFRSPKVLGFGALGLVLLLNLLFI